MYIQQLLMWRKLYAEASATGEGGGTAAAAAAAAGGGDSDAGTSAAGQDSGDGDGEAGAGTATAGAGAGNGDWRSYLSADLRDAPALKDVKDPNDLAQQFVNAQGLIGNSVRIPSEHASAEDWEQFHSTMQNRVPNMAVVDPENPETALRALGAPAEVSGYKLPDLSKYEGVLAPGRLEEFGAMAHEAGLTQRQFERVVTKYTEGQAAIADTNATSHQAEMEALHKEWGFGFDDKVAAATRAAQLTGAPDELVGAIGEGKVKPNVLKWLAGVAEKLGAENQMPDGGQARANTLTPAEAQVQLDEVMNNSQHPYWMATPGTPEKNRAIDQVLHLRELSMGKEGREVHSKIDDHDDREGGGTFFAGKV